MTFNNKSLKSERQSLQVSYKIFSGLSTLFLLAHLGIFIHLFLTHYPIFEIDRMQIRAETLEPSYVATLIYQFGLATIFFAWAVTDLSITTKFFCSTIVWIGCWFSLLGLALMANNFTPLYQLYGISFRCSTILFFEMLTFRKISAVFDDSKPRRKMDWYFEVCVLVLYVLLTGLNPAFATQ
jgi:hypothetical protein